MSFRRVLSAAAVGLLAGGSTLVLTGARADGLILPVPPQPAPVTDYANYPANAEVPDGCDAGDIAGVSFSVNGETPVVGLQDLGPLNAGDTVTMTWLAVGAECDPPGTEQVPIVVAMKSAPGQFFDATVDQALDLPYALDFLSAGLGEHSVSYVLPDLLDDSFPGCFGQLDAIVGLPLAVVGPNGSFYSSGLRGGGPNLLISAWNGGYENCQTQETTTTTTGSTTSTTEGTTTTSTPASTTTTSTPASTTTTEPPTTTTEPATTVPPSSTIAAAPTTEPPVLTPAKAQAAQTSRQLAQTGRSSGPWALVGLAVIVGGLVLLVVTRRRLV